MATATVPRWLGKSSRALGVVRVSSKKQGDNNSPGVQRDGITAYAKAHGLHLTDVIVLEESAKSSEARVKFHAALARMKKDKTRHLVFWVWDRSTRNFTDYELLEDLIRGGTMVLHVAHDRSQLHASSEEGDWLKAEMNTLVAKTYSRQLSRRAKESQDAKARDGWYPTRPPLGYRNKKLVGANGVVKDRGGTIELMPEGRVLIRRMYSLRLAGISLEAIGKAVVEEGLWSGLGKKRRYVSPGEVEHLLKHEFYAGWFTWRDERYRGKHEPIFTADEWADLQATFGRRAPYGSPLDKSGALQGFLTCAECGCLITYDPKVKSNGTRYDYYRCANGHRVHAKRIHITETELLNQFEAAIANIEVPHALADEISRVLRETHEVVRTERRREIAVLKRTVEDVQAREDKIVAMYIDGKLDDVTYQRQRETLLNDKHGALDRLSAASEELDDKYLATADRIFELAKQARTLWNQRSPSERRQLLEMVLSNPRLDGVSVRYEMKKPFAILAEMTKGPDWRAQCDSNDLRKNPSFTQDVAKSVLHRRPILRNLFSTKDRCCEIWTGRLATNACSSAVGAGSAARRRGRRALHMTPRGSARASAPSAVMWVVRSQRTERGASWTSCEEPPPPADAGRAEGASSRAGARRAINASKPSH